MAIVASGFECSFGQSSFIMGHTFAGVSWFLNPNP
jgi:hypothetical protein